MPVMDGLEATRRLRAMQQQQTLAPCRVVMLSSHDDEATRQRALEAGCDHYLCKPVAKQVLLQTLGWVAGQLPAPPQPELRTPGSTDHGELQLHAGTAATAGEHAPAPDSILIDPDLIDRMPSFLQSRRELLAALEAAARAGDAEAMRRHAHRLSGSFSLYGLAWAAAQCREIERTGLPEGPLDASLRRLAALRSHLDALQARMPLPTA
jgi:CheY-like chemotaxis protein